ncbi:MAG TPA: ABC transporter substrate-binding protein [Nocardioides sp.]|uniref:ABC transporter substrate-binding protein n=1 Tax=Nocardioides sp. TaxID=35761 RepID=UPI002ED78E53
MSLRRTALLSVPLALALAACAPAEDEATEPAGDATPAADACTTDGLPVKTAGTLTVATDSPAYEPWFSEDDPSNGRGYESAVAYAVAEKLGFAEDEVTWVKVPFNNSYAPGAKEFDFDINQISITPERAEVVDFSRPYYTASQAVITLAENADQAGSLADLKSLKLGAQTGTTSLTAVREQVKPTAEPLVFNDTNAAKQALLNGQVDGIVADLPTAFYISAVEIEGSAITGQFETAGQADEFGLLFEKGNPLRTCVDQVLADLEADGTLADIEQEWLSDVVDVPVLK